MPLLIIVDPAFTEHDSEGTTATMYEVHGKHGLVKLRDRSHRGNFAETVRWLNELCEFYSGEDIRIELNGPGRMLAEATFGKE